MSKPTEFGFGKEVWKTVLLVIEIKHLSPFFWLAAILSMAKLQFFLGWFQLSHKFHGWQPAWQNYDRLSRLSRRLRGLVSRLHSLPVECNGNTLDLINVVTVSARVGDRL